MKRENFIKGAFFRSFIFLAIATALFACKKPQPHEEGPNEENSNPQRVYVLNEGNYNMNNSSITYYEIANNQTVPDIFMQANQRGLGDVANDMKLYNNVIYCVVNNSEQLEALDVETCRSLKQLSLEGKQPRCIAFHATKGYVTCFDGDLLQIDLHSLTIDKSIKVGKNPEGLCVVNNKIYVANSGGLDWPCTENSVSVIDINSFSILKTITTEIGPFQIKAGRNNDLWLTTRGNYDDVPLNFQCIDSETDTVVFTLNLPVLGFDISGTEAFIYNYDFNTSSSWIKVFDLNKKIITNEHFITDGTVIKLPYGIFVNEKEEVYITDALDYTTPGDVYCFSMSGKKKFNFEAGNCPTGNIIVTQ